jgi:hypothetical protein
LGLIDPIEADQAPSKANWELRESWHSELVAQVRLELDLSEADWNSIMFEFRDRGVSEELVEDVIDRVLAVLRHTGPDSIPN